MDVPFTEFSNRGLTGASRVSNSQNLLPTLPSHVALSDWSPPESQTPSSCTSGAQVDARGADWHGLDLSGLDLSETRLCRVDLRGAVLVGTCLDRADLRLARYDKSTIWPESFNYRQSGAIGPQAVLNGCFLNNADLSGMDLNGGSLMGAHLSGANLSGACLRGVRFAGADLRHANLSGALCEGARFAACQLDFVDFRWSSLTEAQLDSAESIRGADFTGASDLGRLRANLLSKPYSDLDCWNPLTRRTTRDSLGPCP